MNYNKKYVLLGLRTLLLLGAAFFVFEFFLHFFGLPILEHDRIFIPTHDRYIALYALLNAALLGVAAYDIQKYRIIFFLVMASIALGIVVATIISASGGYAVFFPTVYLDDELSFLGILAVVWYLLMCLLYLLFNKAAGTVK